MGYNIGAPAPFGMRRMLVDRNGATKGLLAHALSGRWWERRDPHPAVPRCARVPS